MVKTCSFQIVTDCDRRQDWSPHWWKLQPWISGIELQKSVFLTHTELLNNWHPKDNFRFDPISDRQEKNHLVCNNFCAATFVLLFLYFKSRRQISRVTCAVLTRLPASGKLVPSTLTQNILRIHLSKELTYKYDLHMWSNTIFYYDCNYVT